MTLTINSNCGFVNSAPSGANPGSSAITIDTFSMGLKDISPATGIITEIGWYCVPATQEANFEVGIYSHDSANNRPLNLLGVSRTNAKGTTAGWKTVSGLNINVTSGETYWICVQLDDTATSTTLSRDVAVVGTRDYKSAQTTLVDPWGVSTSHDTTTLLAIYALYSVSSSNTIQIDINNVFKNVSGYQININNVWKNISGIKINISGTWKTIL